MFRSHGSCSCLTEINVDPNDMEHNMLIMFLPPGQPCGIQAGTSFAASFTHTRHTHAPASRQEICRLHGSAYVHSPILSHVLPPSHARPGLEYQAGLVWRVWLPGFWAVAFRQRPVESELRLGSVAGTWSVVKKLQRTP